MRPIFRRGVTALSIPLLALSLLGAAPTAASAEPAANGFAFNYWVDATTTLKKLNQTVTVPRGTFVGSIDVQTWALSGSITLPPARAPFRVAGLPLATATFKIQELRPVTGALDPNTLTVTATSVFDIQIVSVTPVGAPTVNLVGNNCKTSRPISVTMSGPFSAGSFSGSYTIPPLQNCGAATRALNLAVPGPGNTFSASVTPRG